MEFAFILAKLDTEQETAYASTAASMPYKLHKQKPKESGY